MAPSTARSWRHSLLDSATTTMPDTRFNLVIYQCDSSNTRSSVDIASYLERPAQEDFSSRDEK